MADAERGRDDDDFGDDDDAPSSSSSSTSPAPAPASSFVHPAALGKTCALCGVDFSGGRRLMRCSGCRLAHYCSLEHQAAHWPAHAEACNAEQARVKAQLSESGLVLGAEAVRENAKRRADDERAAAAAIERARIELWTPRRCAWSSTGAARSRRLRRTRPAMRSWPPALRRRRRCR